MQFDSNNILLIASAAALLIIIVVCILCQKTSTPPFPRKNGQIAARLVTDRFCLALFIVTAVMCGLIVGHALGTGNPKRLTHGYDWQGKVCGFDEGVKDKKMLYFCGSPERTQNAGDGLTYPSALLGWSTTCLANCPTNNAEEIACLMPPFHNFSLKSGGRLNSVNGPKDVRTLDLTVTQSLVMQKSYPTEAFGGRFCLPSKKNPVLKDSIVSGPWGKRIRPWLFIGSFTDAWVLVAMAAVLATLCCMIYFHFLKRCAGVMMFSSIILAMLLLFAAALVFLWVVFVDANSPSKDYAKLNPIFSVYDGREATAYSIMTGVVFMMLSGLCACVAFTSIKHIDEMIGLVAAACECLESNTVFSWVYPLLQTLAFLAWISFVAVSLPYVASLADKQNSSIEVDGHYIEGMQTFWAKSYLHNWELVIYVIFCAWVFEMFVQFGNYCVAYVVSEWYFLPVKEEAPKVPAALKGFADGTGKHVNVRVGGVDQNYGDREGLVTMDARGNRMLVVGVGKKGPGIGRHAAESVVYKKDESKIALNMVTWLISANTTAIFKHLGSLAMGAPLIALFRIPSWFVKCTNAFLTRTSSEDQMNPFQSNHPGTQNFKGMAALLSACLDQAFGKFSKTAYNELILSGGHAGHDAGIMNGFLQASSVSFSALIESGGTIACLHGAMILYEFMGCLAITMFTGWAAIVVQDKVDWFNDPTDPSYIENKNASAIACALAAFVISFSWMAMWNQTADTLLYCLGWNRRQLHAGEKFGLSHSELIHPPGTYCPQHLRYLVPAYELEVHYEDGVHAHGVGQMGSIIAAMEHGAMNTNKQGPNYSSAMGTMFQTGTKIAGT